MFQERVTLNNQLGILKEIIPLHGLVFISSEKFKCHDY